MRAISPYTLRTNCRSRRGQTKKISRKRSDDHSPRVRSDDKHALTGRVRNEDSKEVASQYLHPGVFHLEREDTEHTGGTEKGSKLETSKSRFSQYVSWKIAKSFVYVTRLSSRHGPAHPVKQGSAVRKAARGRTAKGNLAQSCSSRPNCVRVPSRPEPGWKFCVICSTRFSK